MSPVAVTGAIFSRREISTMAEEGVTKWEGERTVRDRDGAQIIGRDFVEKKTENQRTNYYVTSLDWYWCWFETCCKEHDSIAVGCLETDPNYGNGPLNWTCHYSDYKNARVIHWQWRYRKISLVIRQSLLFIIIL